ncbi:CCA tRNA nucleotidyltransferase [Alienimonas chondri]|uniref:Poly(A) polymerase I n=1 Tax=Alienimonas chondri TaxID=2681879 RepID=A0ABX1V8Z7_9PLAN|nr:CCA tRNA nucleotidyltransferase [Alienimonas chondri]NNJ24480.1 Poly(A) polymerase I [Alienimonas chondri]
MTDAERPADPNRVFASYVAEELSRAGYRALFAGGCVRDRLLGKTPKDYDVATDAPPAAVRETFGRKRTLAVGESFGVIVVLPNRRRFPGAQQVEVATFREDAGYADGRRPDAVRFSTPEADALRRDFTINGLFEDPATGEVIDFVGGVADLEAGVLRAIGDPADRMAEDALRMLRFVRFATVLEFWPDEETSAAVLAAADNITAVSGERIGQEMRRLLAAPRRDQGVAMLHAAGLLGYVAPSVAALSPTERSRTRQALRLLPGWQPGPVSFPLTLAALYAQVGSAEEAVRGWRLSNDEARRSEDLLANLGALGGFEALPTHRKKRLLAGAFARDLIALERAMRRADGDDGTGTATADADAAETFLNETPAAELSPAPLLTGGDLIAAGCQPGPQFKQMLDEAYDAQLDGTVRSTEEALALVTR